MYGGTIEQHDQGDSDMKPFFSQIPNGQQTPGSYGRMPGSYGQMPMSYGQMPGSYGQMPLSYGQVVRPRNAYIPFPVLMLKNGKKPNSVFSQITRKLDRVKASAMPDRFSFPGAPGQDNEQETVYSGSTPIVKRPLLPVARGFARGW